MTPLLMITFSLSACLLVASCAGHSKKKSDAPESVGIRTHDEYYVANRSLKKFAAGESSSLEKKVFNANKAFGGTKNVHIPSFSGAKEFTGNKAYTAKNFAQSDKKDQSATKAFAQAGQTSNIADKTFNTKDSRFASKTSQDANKTFREAGSEFQTKDDAIATKAAKKKDNKVVIADYDEPLTEDAVKKLLNKR
jgi:hypothetical protein